MMKFRRSGALAHIVRLGTLTTSLFILVTLATGSFALGAASSTPATVPANRQATQSSTSPVPLIILPSNKACVAGGKLTVQFNGAPHGPWAKVTIYLNGKRLTTLRYPHIKRLVTVTGLPRGSFIIAVTGVTRAGRARAVDRRYKACAVKSEGKEKAEREAKERAEREAKEKAEREAKEKAEREAKERAEREAKEKAEREAKEKAEREAKEKAEREAKEKAEREAKEKEEKEKTPAGVEAGSYSGTDTQGYPMSFYVSRGQSAVQNVVVGTTVMGCTPSKGFDDHFEVASIAIDSEGDFSSTTEQEGEIEHTPAKFKYTISGHLSGTGASGSIREDISFSNGTEYSCTTNTLAWSLTRESVQTEASFPPAAGSYSGTDQQGYPMTFYVSPGGGQVQNVHVGTTVMGCAPSEGFDDHFEVASVVVNPDGSFSSTTEQEGVLKNLPAKFKYTLSGQFHGTGSAGVVRVAGTLREDITYDNGSKFECTTNGEDWSLTRESAQTEASFPPAAGSYSGTDQQGYPMTFEVTSGGTKLQNVSIPTVVVGCAPAKGTDLAFVIKEATIGSDGSFTAKETESATVFAVTATVTYEFSGQFHGPGSGGKVRVAGTLRETAVDESGKTFECTSNGQTWEATHS